MAYATRTNIAEHLAEKNVIPVDEARKLTGDLFEVMREMLTSGKYTDLRIREFGNFVMQPKMSNGNLGTGEMFAFADLDFHPCDGLKGDLNGAFQREVADFQRIYLD